MRSFQAPATNCDPRSVTTRSGIPYLGSHCRMNTFAQEVDIMSGSGKASGHLLKRSTIVSRYLHPSDSGSGPTRSTWIDPNLLLAGGRTVRGAFVCLPTLDAWHGKQVLHHSRICFLIPGQTKPAEMSLVVGLDPLRLKLCRASKTGLRKDEGMRGRTQPPPVSHHNLTPLWSICLSARLVDSSRPEGS